MIRFICAMDSKQGIANEGGIPWQGKLPTDVAYFRKKTLHSTIMMGAGWYAEQQKPLPDRLNVVATTTTEQLRPGFEKVSDARLYLQDAGVDVWVGGGAGLFASTLDLADELYITQLDGDFGCTKFFPKFSDDFTLVSQTEPQTENGITFRFQVWQRRC